MASDHEKYDGALLGILQNEGKVAPFLDVILGFLYRRTDFFRVMKADTDRLGFPPGIAHKLLENIFRKYETMAKNDAEKVEEMRKAREKEAREREAREKELKEKEAKEHEKEEQKDSVMEDIQVSSAELEHGESTVEKRKEESSTVSSSSPVEEEVKMETDSSVPTADDAKNQNADKPSGDEDEDKEEDPEQARQRRELQANPLTYNGAEREKYYWSQTITETDLRVKVPSSIIKGKQVKVNIQKKHVSVAAQGSDGSWSDIVDSDLSWEVNTEESLWSLVPGEFVHINLEKKQERWWENVFVDEPKINTRKIDCSRPMTDLDDEAQAKIEEMMYNQRQKQLGLPQTHEAKTHEMLRKAWDAEGSPFKGQPFDPSRFSVDPSGTVNFKEF